MLLLFSLFKSQTVICNYTEINSISNGYICEGDDLVFTANLDTIVTGTISASNSILVTPSPNYSITIQPAFSCNNCTTDTGGTTIIPKKNGNGGAQERLYSDSKIFRSREEIIFKENPVNELLKVCLKKGLIKKIIIFDKSGKEIMSSYNLSKAVEINVSRFPKGIYGVKIITNDNQIYTKQFIKN